MRKLAALLVGAALMMATSAMATPISGSINFTGALNLIGGTSLPTATGIDFTNPALVADGGTGIYASIPSFPSAGLLGATTVIFSDFNFPVTSAVVPLWTLTYGPNTYDFDLYSITNITATSISGTGSLGATGFEDTLGLWQLTTQAGSGTLSFSATSSVPEPGTMMLLGLGIFGLAIFGKRRMNKDA